MNQQPKKKPCSYITTLLNKFSHKFCKILKKQFPKHTHTHTLTLIAWWWSLLHDFKKKKKKKSFMKC
jgi:hypothetical protein